ncbi:MAG: hypothetical protein V2A73_06705, partial [Pseudomonadota bacterium]
MAFTLGGITPYSMLISSLSRYQTQYATAVQRLSTGLRINGAADDSAGLAMATQLNAQIGSSNQAIRNANDTTSLLQVADGGLSAVQTALGQARELAVQAANASATSSQRIALNQELQGLLDEIDDIAAGTSFNGINLINGNIGEASRIQASAAQVGTIASTETLTFSGPLFNGLSTASTQVTLAVGMSQTDVVAAINSSLVGQSITASAKGGILYLTPNGADSASSFAVVSNRAAGGGASGIGTTKLVLLSDNPGTLSTGTAATVTAPIAQTATLAKAETLTFSGMLFDALSTSEKQVSLNVGMDQVTVAKTINDSTVGAFVTASVVDGKLTITSNTDEVAGTFSVVSDQAAAVNQTGIGSTAL